MTDAQVERLIAVLERIAIAQERVALAFAPDATAPAPTSRCDGTHPAELRSDESTMGFAGRFLCDPRLGGCGYRNY